jgi:hypothetical protein
VLRGETISPLPATDLNPTATHRADPPHSKSAVDNGPTPVSESMAPAVDSVLAQYQRAMTDGVSPRPTATLSRQSRREQTAKAAEHPFVRRAIELFDAPPDKLRYTPPEGSPSTNDQ